MQIINNQPSTHNKIDEFCHDYDNLPIYVYSLHSMNRCPDIFNFGLVTITFITELHSESFSECNDLSFLAKPTK